MNNRPVLYYDSGIGGLCYGHFFHSRNPDEKTICLGDRANFPYGMKSKDELITLTISMTEKIISVYNPKIMALACNAASVSALSELREKFPDLPIVGTVPAVKPAVMASKKRRIGVLGTRRTVSDPYINELIAKHGPDCEIVGMGPPELPEFIEHRWTDADENEKFRTAKFYIDQFREKDVDVLVLACTHYPLLKKEFEKAANGSMQIFDSVEGISARIETLLDADGGKLRSGSEIKQKPVMAVTGDTEPEPYWEKLASHFGFTLERI